MTTSSSSFNIPRISSTGNSQADVSRFLVAMSTLMQTREGQRGDGSGKVVTMADLQKLGLVSNVSAGVTTSYDLSSKVVDAAAPRAPRDLVVTPRVWCNDLSWDNPTDKDLSHIEVWCAQGSQSRDDAFLIALVTQPVHSFSHGAISTQSEYTYWIRAVDYAGNHSPWCPPDAQGGYVAPAAIQKTITEVLSTLSGSITEDQLYQALVQRIDCIDTSASVLDNGIFEPGVVGGLTDYYLDGSRQTLQVKDDITVLQATTLDQLIRIKALDSQVSGFVATDFSTDTLYSLGSYTRYEGFVYRCIKPIPAIPAPLPTDTEYWKVSPDIVELVSDVDSKVDTLESKISMTVSSATFDLLTNRVTASETSISQQANTIELKADKTELDVVSDRVSSLSTIVDVGSGNFEVLTSSVLGDLALLDGIVEAGVLSQTFADVYGLDNRLSMTDFKVDANEGVLIEHATQIASAQVKLNANEGVLIEHATQIASAQEILNTVKGQWTIKLQQNGFNKAVAGVGLMLDPVSAASEFAVLADKFEVIDPATVSSAAPLVPFVVGKVNGQYAVGINGNMVADGTIMARHLDAGAVTARTLASDLAIVNTLRSGNYSPGGSGWMFNGSGGEINAGVAINGALLVNGSVSGTKITAGSITGDHIKANSLNAAAVLVSGSIGADQIAANSITAGKIAASSIDASKIIAGSIDSNQISVNGIDISRIASGVVKEIATNDGVAGPNNTLTASLSETLNCIIFWCVRISGYGGIYIDTYLDGVKIVGDFIQIPGTNCQALYATYFKHAHCQSASIYCHIISGTSSGLGIVDGHICIIGLK